MSFFVEPERLYLLSNGKSAMENTEQQTLAERLDLADLISGLIQDLRDLRAGKISVRDAQARAVLAKQILRGVHYVVTAQKFIEQQAKALEGPATEPKPRRNRARI